MIQAHARYHGGDQSHRCLKKRGLERERSFNLGFRSFGNFGGGITWWFRERLGMRLEARDYCFGAMQTSWFSVWEFLSASRSGGTGTLLGNKIG